jgi:hypothetical protein
MRWLLGVSAMFDIATVTDDPERLTEPFRGRNLPERRKERDAMTMKAIRMRVRAGNLEPLDALPLAEGTEVTAMVPVPDGTDTEGRPKLVLPKWDLGVKEPLTREEVYEDAG